MTEVGGIQKSHCSPTLSVFRHGRSRIAPSFLLRGFPLSPASSVAPGSHASSRLCAVSSPTNCLHAGDSRPEERLSDIARAPNYRLQTVQAHLSIHGALVDCQPQRNRQGQVLGQRLSKALACDLWPSLERWDETDKTGHGYPKSSLFCTRKSSQWERKVCLPNQQTPVGHDVNCRTAGPRGTSVFIRPRHM